MVISHELDAVRYIRHGFRRSQLFSLILQRDQHFGTMGRTWSGYKYDIPDQFQGRFERLRVLGDKRARSSALQIAERPELLDRLRREAGVPIRVLHVTRNPFDNIATEARRHQMSITDATAWYEQICTAVGRGPAAPRPVRAAGRAVRGVRGRSPGDHWPRSAASSASNPRSSYLDACAAIVWPSTNRTRDAIEWTRDERRGVERLIERFELLGPYTFEE